MFLLKVTVSKGALPAHSGKAVSGAEECAEILHWEFLDEVSKNSKFFMLSVKIFICILRLGRTASF